MKAQHLVLVAILAGVFTVGCAGSGDSMDTATDAASEKMEGMKDDAKGKANEEVEGAASEAKDKAMDAGGKY